MDMELDSGQNFGMANLSMEFLMQNKDNNMGNFYSYHLEGHLQNADSVYHAPSFFFHNITKTNSRSEVPFMIPNHIHSNIKRKFENFTKYIASKENNFMKEPEHWSEMSSGYAEFVTSPRNYSYVSNSIASYLIGGFVGSKSQMNCEKPKLSYDLGEVIKILSDYKCDKSFDKLKEEKKFDLNKCGKKQKSFLKDYDVIMQNACNTSLYKDLTSNPSDTNCAMNEDVFPTFINEYLDSSNLTNQPLEENVKDSSTEIFERITSSIVTQQEATDENNSVTIDSFKNSEESVDMIPGGDVEGNRCCAAVTETHSPHTLKNENNLNDNDSCSKSETNFNSNNHNNISNVNNLSANWLNSQKSRNTVDYKYKEWSEVDIDRKCMNPLTAYVNCAPNISRIRQSSECSIDSTDSESFIVFDDGYCDGSVDQLPNQLLQESENEFSESTSDSDSQDDGDNYGEEDDGDNIFEDVYCYCYDSDEYNSSCSSCSRNANGYRNKIKRIVVWGLYYETINAWVVSDWQETVESILAMPKRPGQRDVIFEEDEVAGANARWSESYKNVDASDNEKSKRKVRFNSKVEIHRMIAWDFAYRAARIGPWEQMVRDRIRFRERIHRLSSVISPILVESHRKSIYNKLHVD